MAEIFSTAKPKESGERKSIAAIRALLGRTTGDHNFSSFAIFPNKVCFETQGEGEQVVLFLRQHIVVNLPWVLLVILAISLQPVFIFFPPYASLPTNYQFVVSVMWYLLTVGFAIGKFMSWFFNIYIVTDERIVDVDFIHLFNRQISTAKIEEIQDVTVKSSGAFETFFNYGGVFIQTAAEVTQFEFLKVPRPDRVGKIINQMIDLEEQEKLEGRVK